MTRAYLLVTALALGLFLSGTASNTGRALFQGTASHSMHQGLSAEIVQVLQGYIDRSQMRWALPKGGAIPDAKTAVRVAEPIFEAAFGSKALRLQQPLLAGRSGQNWIVTGTLQPNVADSGNLLELQASDGKIVFLGR